MTATRGDAPGRGDSRAPVWAAVGAWGLGLVGVALGAAAIVGLQADAVSRALGAIAVAQGVAALGWGAAILWSGRVLFPRTAIGGAASGIAVAVALLVSGPGRTSVFATTVVVGLGVAVAVAIARGTRHPSRPSGVARIVVAAAIVAVVVTPALGSAQDAALLRSDGTIAPPPTHGGH